MKEKEAKIIIALSFGQGIDRTPGVSNEALAKVVLDLHKRYGLPIVAQCEIADCVKGLIDGDRVSAVRDHREKGKYLDTYEVVAQAWEFAKKRGIQKAVIVAHPDRAPRCAAVAAKMGFDAEIADTANVPYDPDSVQEWTRDKDFFTRQYEPKAMKYYRQLGYID